MNVAESERSIKAMKLDRQNRSNHNNSGKKNGNS